MDERIEVKLEINKMENNKTKWLNKTKRKFSKKTNKNMQHSGKYDKEY